MNRRLYQQTTVISLALTGFLLGLVIARKFTTNWTVVGLCVCLLPLLWRRNILSVLSMAIIGLLLGCWRGSVFMQRLVPYQQLSKKPVIIVATATSDAVYGEKSQLVFDVSKIQLQAPYARNLEGTIGIKGYGEQMIYRGDRVLVSAKLYATRGSRQGLMSFAKISRLSTGTSAVESVRRRFSAGLQSVLPEPLGSLSLGILVGQRTTLPQALNEQMSVVGLTHIVAVSGYNLTILINLAQRRARKRSAYQAAATMLCLLLGFLVLTGYSASIVRAAVVGVLSIWAGFYGRTFRPHVILLLSAAVTAGWFPPYLWSDLGWHLSFLAFAGILIIAPLIMRRFCKQKPRWLLSMAIETVSAQLLTAPLIMYTFGKLSVVGLIANTVVVPLVPLAMALSFVAGLAGLCAPFLAGWFAWPATVLMTYMVDCIAIFARVPHAAVTQYITAWHMICLYIVLAMALCIIWKKLPKSVTITE